ncbi:MAG: hypothetical protein WD845_15625, partial [Pirellulales bacterium]
MPKPTTLGVHRSAPPAGWHLPALPPTALPLAIGLLAVAVMASGIALLVLHALATSTENVLVPAGVALLACSFLQWRTAWMLWRPGGTWSAIRERLDWAHARRALLGIFGAYALALVVGPARYIEYALLAAVVCWLTLLLLPLAAVDNHWRRWTAWSRHRAARRLEWLAFGSMALLIAAELGLQGAKALHRAQWFAGASVSPPTEGVQSLLPLAHESLLRHGVAPLPAGPLRVALLTDDPRRDCHGERGCRTHIERALPGVKIVPAAFDGFWASLPAGAVAEQLADQRVDLVLAMLTVCDELTRERPAPSWFDWRQLELARMVGAQAEVPADAPASSTTAADFESFCGIVSPQLAACRTPIDDRMRQRWQQTFASVDALADACRANRLSLAIVLVPGEFQLNRALRDTLARRAGYAADRLDVELPQRKLAGYAAERRLPLVDLLPTLRLCRESPYERHAEHFSATGHQATAAA